MLLQAQAKNYQDAEKITNTHIHEIGSKSNYYTYIHIYIYYKA